MTSVKDQARIMLAYKGCVCACAWVGLACVARKAGTYRVELFGDSPYEEETAGDLDEGCGEGASDPAEEDVEDFEDGCCLDIGDDGAYGCVGCGELVRVSKEVLEGANEEERPGESRAEIVRKQIRHGGR